MKNYDKSLIEVWRWKGDVYEDVKGMNDKEHIEKIRNDSEKILSDSTIILKPISRRKDHQISKE